MKLHELKFINMNVPGVFSIVCIFFVCFDLARSMDPSCKTPDDDPGMCISIKECSPLYSILRKKPIPNAEKAFLKKSLCGFSGTVPKVCCPIPFKDITSDLLPDKSICGHHTGYRIFGGTKTSLKEFPWMALLEYEFPNHQRAFLCGGVLISQRYVLTASHCVKGGTVGKLVSVRLGEYDTKSDQDCIDNRFRKECNRQVIDVPVEESITYENFNSHDKNRSDDIALLRLSNNVTFTDTVQPICLPLKNVERMKTYIGDKLTVAGWGTTENKTESNVKLKLEVPVKSRDICNSLYSVHNMSITPSQLCAGGEKGKDSCSGDSGGPLMALSTDKNAISNWLLVGIVSYGPTECGLGGWPAVYTRVSKYIPWIVSNLKV